MVLCLESIWSLILHQFKSIELQFIDKFTAFSHSIPSHKTLAFCDKKHCILCKLWHKSLISHKLDNKHLISFKTNIKINSLRMCRRVDARRKKFDFFMIVRRGVSRYIDSFLCFEKSRNRENEGRKLIDLECRKFSKKKYLFLCRGF